MSSAAPVILTSGRSSLPPPQARLSNPAKKELALYMEAKSSDVSRSNAEVEYCHSFDLCLSVLPIKRVVFGTEWPRKWYGLELAALEGFQKPALDQWALGRQAYQQSPMARENLARPASISHFEDHQSQSWAQYLVSASLEPVVR